MPQSRNKSLDYITEAKVLSTFLICFKCHCKGCYKWKPKETCRTYFFERENIFCRLGSLCSNETGIENDHNESENQNENWKDNNVIICANFDESPFIGESLHLYVKYRAQITYEKCNMKHKMRNYPTIISIGMEPLIFLICWLICNVIEGRNLYSMYFSGK